MSLLQNIILTILSLLFIEINGKSLNNPSTFQKLPPTVPSFQPKVNLSSPINAKQSITLGAVKPTGQNRHGKFFYSPSFLTGLGIGSLASSAALSSSSPMMPSNPELPTKRHSRPMNVFMDTNQSLPRPQMPLPQHYVNVYDAAYPYLAFSTSLFEQTLRSIYNVLESLKNQLASKEPPSELSRVIVKNYNDEVNSAEETSNIKVFSKNDSNHLSVIDRSTLKHIIKESIEEINKDLEQRQADSIRDRKNTTNNMMLIPPVITQEKTENISIDKPVAETPIPTTAQPISTTSKPGYYGGNPLPIQNVNLIHGFPSTEYGYPHPEVHYGPPSSIFDHGNVNGFPQNYHEHEFGFGQTQEVFNENYYHPEPYFGANENHSPADSFSSPSSENLPIYPPYARAFKFSSKSTPKANNFRPSKLI